MSDQEYVVYWEGLPVVISPFEGPIRVSTVAEAQKWPSRESAELWLQHYRERTGNMVNADVRPTGDS
jgi:hypothetical protein